MANAHGNRSFMTETTRSGSPLYGFPDTQLRRQYPGHETFLLNHPQETHFDEALVSAFSRLGVSRDYCYEPLSDNLVSHGFLSITSQEMEQTNQNCLSLNLQNCDSSAFGFVGLQNCSFYGFVPGLDSTSNNFSQIRSNQTGFLGDYRDGELKNHFPILSNQTGLLGDYRDGELNNHFSILSNQTGFLGDYRDGELNNHFSILSNQTGFLGDYRDGELNNHFSILPSSTRNMFANTVLPKDRTASRSGLTTKKEYLSVGDFRGIIVASAKDQSKCNQLQRIMNGGLTREEIDMIFFEVIDRVGELMIDHSGNYVVQKLVDMCSEEQRTQILLMLTKVDFQLVRICLDIHGSRAVLRLLEKLSTPQQISLVATALRAGAVALTKDPNGHHVIQHCLKYFSYEDNKYLLNVVADNCYGIATDKSGCCVLQQCVEYSKGAQREHLVAEIIANVLLLAEDCYGNYVVQHILGLRVPQITANLLRQLEGHYTSLSCNKYGSNVVEKCLAESGEQQSMRIIMELLGSPNVSMLLMDPFGNYVIQSALSVSKGFVHDALRNLIRINSPMMRSNIYGKKVLAWFERRRLSYM